MTSALLNNLRALSAIQTQQALLVAEKHQLERRARETSPPTQSRARCLMTEATLALLSRQGTVTITALLKELECRSGDRDRFALDLCRDWIDAALSS